LETNDESRLRGAGRGEKARRDKHREKAGEE
jgi:hypothetical protein